MSSANTTSIEQYLPLVQIVTPKTPQVIKTNLDGVYQPSKLSVANQTAHVNAPMIVKVTETEKIIQNGIWTIKNRKTGDHRTFKIKTLPVDEKSKNSKPSRLVLLMIGSDNTSNYKPFGFVSERGNQIFVFKKLRSDIPGKKSDFEMFALLLEDKFVHQSKFNSCELIGSATCLRCNRLLTTPESVERNYGPECWGKIGG